MKAKQFILVKQVQWAQNMGIKLIGSKIDKGFPAYTLKIDENLFAPLSLSTKNAFQAGDGGELSGDPAKMQAVHSSSALGVNIFQYWDSVKEVSKIAYKCGFCSKNTRISKNISFEVKYSIDDRFQFSPNIDVVINNKPTAKYKVYAIECKFSEAYGGFGHSGIKKKYLDLDIWEGIPNLHNLAISISPTDNKYQHLHAAQMIKHILGLKRSHGKEGFRLLYLWYDVLGSEGAIHKEGIINFLEIAKSDDIKIHELSYQDLISRIADDYRNSHKKYVEYVTNRYL